MEKKTYVKAAAEVVAFKNNDAVNTAPNDGCGGPNTAGITASMNPFGSWGC